MSSTSPYTCITCHVAFQTGDLQRAHYKTDWHRYNLKRKVADLGPISATEFAEKVEAVQQRTDQINEKDQRSSLMCKDCGKAFTSENGLLNHIKSRKHAETVAKNAQNDSKKTRQIVESPKENPTEPMDDDDEGEEEVEDDDDEWNDMDDGATVTRNKMKILRKQKTFHFESIFRCDGCRRTNGSSWNTVKFRRMSFLFVKINQSRREFESYGSCTQFLLARFRIHF